MNRIILPFVVLAFVQLVNGQTQACIDAATALAANTVCAAAFSTGTDANTLCMGTCRDLFNDIISTCDATTANAYSILLSTLCNGGNSGSGDACMTVTTALATNTGCTTAISTGTDATILCMGTCRDLFNDIISTCDATTASDYSNLISTLCSACGMAQLALVANTDCADATDASTICMGTCRDLINDIINNCNDSISTSLNETITTLCDNTGCSTATTALVTNSECSAAFVAGTDTTTLCMGTCRDLFDDIISNCDTSISSAYSTLVGTLCDGGNTGAACTTAVDSVSDACMTSLSNGDMSVCSGICAAQLNVVESACRSTTDSDIQETLNAYNTVCGSGRAACATATAAILADTTCDQDTVPASVLCTGSCRMLADNFINACPANDITVIAVREEINLLCGSTADTVLQSCTITSPSANTVRVSCELSETFTRINVIISSSSCTCPQPITTAVGNNPITVSDLPIGVYTVEVTAVNSNDMSIENNTIVEKITVYDKSTATDESDSSSLSTGAAVAIGCVITLLVSVTVTAIVTYAISYMLMKRKDKITLQDNINQILYEEVASPSHTDLELQQNPAYDTGSEVVMDTNPAYESAYT